MRPRNRIRLCDTAKLTIMAASVAGIVHIAWLGYGAITCGSLTTALWMVARQIVTVFAVEAALKLSEELTFYVDALLDAAYLEAATSGLMPRDNRRHE